VRRLTEQLEQYKHKEKKMGEEREQRESEMKKIDSAIQQVKRMPNAFSDKAGEAF